MAADWILIDTCVWSPFLEKRSSVYQATIRRLLEEDRVAIAGPIIFELSRGLRRKEQASWLGSQLRKLHWVEASNLDRELTRIGHDLPSGDLQIAAVAIRIGCGLFSTDPHFDLIPNLKRFDPAS